MLKRRMQTVQTADCADYANWLVFFKVNFDLLYILELFTFGRVRMPIGRQLGTGSSNMRPFGTNAGF